MSLFRREVVEASQDRLHGEVVFTHSLSTKVMVAALFAIIAIAGIWVFVGTYARIETVPGILVTDSPSSKIVVPQAGLVSELAVAEGQAVRKGDRLLIINSDREAASGVDVAGRGVGVIEARRALNEAQIAMASSRASAESSRLESVISSAREQAENLASQIELQEEVVASNQRIFDQVAEVVKQGFVSRVEFERRRQTLISSQQALATLEQRHLATIAEAQQARSQLASAGFDAAQGISRIQDSLQAMSAEQARLEGEQSYVITAPIDGRVTALAIGEGRSATPGRPLMTIVPEGAKLTAELYAPTRSIGFVEQGKETRLLYDAFPYQRFGSFEGRVTSISRIAIDPRETEIPFPFEEPVYRVKVKLENQEVEGFGEPAPLQPGMTLQANIVLERQSFLAWLLKPLNAVLNRTS